MDAHIIEWLNLTVRWIHIITGIAWIGSSFYFNWLENALNRTKNLRDEIAGDLWAIHGGGFYYLEKYKVSPESIPKNLHWFKYEAYFTWISGFSLLIIVYYLNANLYMVDSGENAINPNWAILIGIWTLIGGWFLYDALCETPLVKNPLLFSFLGLFLVMIIAYLLTQVFSSRAAYIHVGALIGTCMAANVFRVIIPSQKKLVKAAKEGKKPDPKDGKKAAMRSLHNNYMTLPVLFIMISNHFPSTYGNEYNWLILGALFLIGAGVRHYYNMRGKGKGSKAFWILPAAILGMALLTWYTSPTRAKSFATTDDQQSKVSFSTANAIIQSRCTTCHSASPTDDLFVVAPNGVMFDTPEQIKKHADNILIRSVHNKTMPLANKTGMTEEERETLRRWIEQGAVIKE